MSWDAHIITGFPSMFPGTLGESLAGRALHDGLWSLTTHDVRAHGQGKHRNIDDTPAGGGVGMVMRADVAASALDSVTARHSLPVLLPSPRGVRWTQSLAQELAEGAGVGVQIDNDDTAFLFGEDQARYLIGCNFDQAEALMGTAAKAGVPIAHIGKFTGHTVRFGKSEAALEALAATFRNSFAAAVA